MLNLLTAITARLTVTMNYYVKEKDENWYEIIFLLI